MRIIPVHRDELLQALAAGKSDIAASNLSITEERERLVDFSAPGYRNVSELLVSGPASPAVTSVDELANKEVFVRTSSSYYESLVALNRRFAAEHLHASVLFKQRHQRGPSCSASTDARRSEYSAQRRRPHESAP